MKAVLSNSVQDGWDLVREDKTGAVTSTTKYLVPEGEVLAFERDGEMFYLHGDALSSTQFITDENGDQVARFVYGAWGEELHAVDNVPGGTECRFVGGLGVRTDPVTGLIYMRHRWYSVEEQRFISRDPIGLWGGNNLYRYSSNPVKRTDPYGLDDTGSMTPLEVLSESSLLALDIFGAFVGTAIAVAPQDFGFGDGPGLAFAGARATSAGARATRIAQATGATAAVISLWDAAVNQLNIFSESISGSGNSDPYDPCDDFVDDIAGIPRGYGVRKSSPLRTTRIYAGKGSNPFKQIKEGVLEKLTEKFPQTAGKIEDWSKRFGKVEIEDIGGSLDEAEIHWYQHPLPGKVWKKMKGFTDRI